MHSFQYDFFPDPAQRGEEFEQFDDSLYWFLGCLRKSGQVIGALDTLVELDGCIRFNGMAPAEDSLEHKYHSTYGQDVFAKLLAQSVQPPQLRLLGKILGASDVCACSDPSCYILFTTFIAIAPPVQCGDCDLPIPLYRLPLIYGEKDYSALVSWESTYQSCDTLFMQSGVGERFGYRQMAQHDSPLSKVGREICAAMTEAKQRSFYYFLMKYYSAQKEICPSCGDSWRLAEPLHSFYEFKCDRCFLLSSDENRLQID